MCIISIPIAKTVDYGLSSKSYHLQVEDFNSRSSRYCTIYILIDSINMYKVTTHH